MNVATFLVPTFWDRLSILVCAIVLQIILVAKSERLEWDWINQCSDYGKKDLSRNLSFKFSRWLTMMNLLYCGIIFNKDINHLSSALWLTFLGTTLILIFLNYYNHYNNSRVAKFGGLIMIPVLIGIVVSAFLSFGTQFIWIPVLLLYIDDDEITYCIDSIKLNHRLLFIVFAVVGVISTVIQFQSVIANFVFVSLLNGVEAFSSAISELLLIQIWHFQLWLWLTFILIPVLVYFLVRKLILRKRNKKIFAQNLILRNEEERLRKKKCEELKKEEQLKIKKIRETLNPSLLTRDDLVFIAGLYNRDELPNFNLDVILQVELKIVIGESKIKQQFVYGNSLVTVLRMYNQLFDSSFNDKFLNKLTDQLDKLCEYVSLNRKYTGAYALRKVIEEKCRNFPMYAWGDGWSVNN